MKLLKTQNSTHKKVNNFNKKIPDAAILVHISQYNTDKENKIKLVTTTVLNTKLIEAENEMSYNSSLVTTTVLKTKI